MELSEQIVFKAFPQLNFPLESQIKSIDFTIGTIRQQIAWAHLPSLLVSENTSLHEKIIMNEEERVIDIYRKNVGNDTVGFRFLYAQYRRNQHHFT